MTATDDAIRLLKKMEGILDAFELDQSFSDKIQNIEKSITSETGEEVYNEAYEVVMTKKKRICVVYDDNSYHHIKRSAVIELRSPEGELIGTEVLPEQMDELKKRDDVIWVSKDFVMFVDKANGPSRFVLPPMKFYEFENVKGFEDAIWSSPSPPSSEILKARCGLERRPKTSTMIIGFDSD